MKKHTVLSLHVVLSLAVILSFLFLAVINIAAQATTCGAKDYDCQIRDYQGRIKANPKDAESYYSLGVSFHKKGDYAQAIAMFDIYLASSSVKPEYLADGYNYRGISYGKLEKNDLAIKDYTKAIELVPTEALFYSNRGSAYSRMQNFALAIADLTKAIGIKKDDAGLYFSRGYAYMELRDNEKALADFTQTLALDPTDDEAYYNRGTIYYRLKEYAKAITDLDKYISLNQADAIAMGDGYTNRGLSYFYLGNPTKAIDDFTKAIELSPKEKSAYKGRALAYRQVGKIALAEADEKKAAEL